MKQVLTVTPIENGFIWNAKGTHGIKIAYAQTVAEVVEKSTKLQLGTEPATPPTFMEAPDLTVWEAGVGYVITAARPGGLGFEIVAFLPPDATKDGITNALERVIKGEQWEIEHRHRHAAEENVRQFPKRIEDMEDEDDPKKVN